MLPTARGLIAFLVAGALTNSLAADAAIGVAMANGGFLLNDVEVQGNSSLFDGSTIQTDLASSKLRLDRGVRLELAVRSRAKIFTSRTVLEKGAGQMEASASYTLEALSLRISPSDPKAIARVRLEGPAVTVSAVNGSVRVSNAGGRLIANLGAGKTSRFQPQDADSNSFEVSGCLLKKNGRFLVVDSISSQVFDLTDVPASATLGNRVTVKGIKASVSPPSGSTAVIQVKSLIDVAPGGCLATAANLSADPLPGSSTSPPKAGSPPNKAVIYGVIIGGGAAAGVGVALASSSKSKSP